jgi:hypothetical protein
LGLLQIPGNGPVHSTGINEYISQRFGKKSGSGAFPAGGVAINGYIDLLHEQVIKLRKIRMYWRNT